MGATSPCCGTCERLGFMSALTLLLLAAGDAQSRGTDEQGGPDLEYTLCVSSVFLVSFIARASTPPGYFIRVA